MDLSHFQQWCHQLHLSPATCDLVDTIRSSPPWRRVQGHAHNVSGTYASHKMGCTIQFESHTVELWGIYVMEYDSQVVEYYDQPKAIRLEYLAPSGRHISTDHTPDFFVLRTDGAGWEEYKTETRLLELAVSQPYRYQRTQDGGWRCPPGEAYAQQLGLTYRVRSSAALDPTYIRNLIFLEDYLFEYIISRDSQSHILDHVEAVPGMTLAALQHAEPKVRLDDVYALIARNHLYVDLFAAPLIDHQRVHLYPDQTTAEAHSLLIAHRAHAPFASLGENLFSMGLVSLSVNTLLHWDGRVWRLLNLGQTTTVLVPDLGPPVSVPTSFFLHLIDTKTITVPPPTGPDEASLRMAELHRIMTEAGPEALAVANQRFPLVQAYLQRKSELYEGTSPRTLRSWATRFHAAEVTYGSGYVGLLPKTAARGNRTSKAPEATRALMDTYIHQYYERPKQQHARDVYRLYAHACLTQDISPLTERTFYRRLKAHMSPEQTEKRRGKRAAYQEATWYWTLSQTTPRHGDRPWEIVHLDHTELDVELRSMTGKLLGRPWMTFLMDAYSRRILSCYLTFDPPSYRSCMMALRVCVRRHARLPQILVVDGGAEFHSTYFDSLLAHYSCTKKTRPGAEPRFGSIIERIFGTTNTQFIHNLLGNTQASKIPRQMTKAVNPKHQAVWTLPDVYEFLCEWAYEIYDQEEHATLGESPRDMFALGHLLGGEREHRRVLYDDTFLMATRPSTRRGQALVHPGRGIKMNYVYYWNDALRHSDVERTSVPVRYDPFDIGVVYVYVRNRWVECIATPYYGQFHGHSERELLLITEELRQQNRKNHVTTSITAKRIAEFLTKIEEHETVLLQWWRDQETREVLYALEQTGTVQKQAMEFSRVVEAGVSPTSTRDTALLAPVDLSTLQVYEEYQ